MQGCDKCTTDLILLFDPFLRLPAEMHATGMLRQLVHWAYRLLDYSIIAAVESALWLIEIPVFPPPCPWPVRCPAAGGDGVRIAPV